MNRQSAFFRQYGHYWDKINHSPAAKRLSDIVCSFAGLVTLSPLLLICAAAIRLDSPGEIYFTQTRIGKNRKPFTIYKLRTMQAEPGNALITSADDRRITRVGRVLRRTKIDEIPQLVNVLWGDMSLVGPRPEVPAYVAYYPEQSAALIFSVRPGITDFASLRFIDEEQILARSQDREKTYVEKVLPMKLRYYRFYVKHRSLALDMYLILQTVAAVFRT